MATKAKKKPASAKAKGSNGQETKRVWLMYPPQKITRPILWELGQKFKVVTNIRQASVTEEIGIVCLELDGKGTEIAAAIKWLGKNGINVEPVEINVMAS